MHCYARLLAHHPLSVIAAVAIVAGTCIVISLTLKKLPNFQDPQMGFEPRGTVLARRETAWNNLMEATKPSGPLTTNPYEEEQRRDHHLRYKGGGGGGGGGDVRNDDDDDNHTSSASQGVLQTSARNKPSPNRGVGLSPVRLVVPDRFNTFNQSSQVDNLTIVMSPDSPFANNEDNVGEIIKMENGNEELEHEQEHMLGNDSNSGFFCGVPLNSYAHVVFSSVHGENLFTARLLKSVCSLEERWLRAEPHFDELCETTGRHGGACCRSWSVGNYVALLRNRSSCSRITREDVRYVHRLLRKCAKFYYDLQLQSDCEERGATACRGIPPACYRHNAAYHIFHFLADTSFLNPKPPAQPRQLPTGADGGRLTHTMVFLPMACSGAALPYFKALPRLSALTDGLTRVTAMDLGLKHVLFDEYLVSDTIFIGLAGGVILLFMWMYTNSFFITAMTVVAIVFSLSIAYFLYTLIFKIKFFPFMNLLTAVIVIGIGADDAFIYCKVWACAKSEKNNGTLVKLVYDTLRHATLSMFVTSLTTAAAFYASYVSSITAIRCFSVFAGTTVLANFFLTVTWLPATVVIAERWCSSNTCICIPPFGLYAPQLQRHPYCSKLCNVLWRLHYRFSDWSRVFFEKILPCIVVKPRHAWVAVLGSVAVGAVLVVFYRPRLHLPDSSEFQFFASGHPFEQYDMVYKDQFWFERVRRTDILSKLPVRVVWGVLPEDNGDYMDPTDRGSLIYDPSFDVSAPASQEWLFGFCRRLRNQSFYQSTPGPLLPNCFVETFESWMDRRCVDPVSQQDRSPCCESSRFPYPAHVFNLCIRRAMRNLYETPALYFMPDVAGPRFDRATGLIQALVIEYDSRFPFTFSHPAMSEFVTQVETWVQGEMSTAPPGMRGGWFVSYVDTFDLQESLARGTAVAIGVAMAIAFLVLFLTTLNLLITLYAIVTIACVIFVTVGSLVLLGWKLNMLESVTVSVAIGLAVDFTLHYGVHYKLSLAQDGGDRESAVVYSVSRMGSPIAMAAFTTFLAGLFMLPSNVLGYVQIGTFVMIVMAVSWIYSTFFFQSLLRLFGPQRNFGQFSYPSLDGCCCCTPAPAHVDKTVYSYALSDSTMSTSSIGFPAPPGTLNESHELEPLANTPGARSADRLLTVSGGGHGRFVKHKATNSHSKGGNCQSRQRSGSLSVVALERDVAMASLASGAHVPRKVSLPVAVAPKASDDDSQEPSPIRHVAPSVTTSSTVLSDEAIA